MAVPHKLGVALSGGGFRAAAFHLGVFKRLRELGLLSKVDVLSTVSGGSITGAYWTHYLKDHDALDDEREWNRFERSLIELMSKGLRWHVFTWAFLIPVFVLGLIAGAIVWPFWPVSPLALTVIVLAVFGMSYLFWHNYASTILMRLYDRKLFQGRMTAELRNSRKNKLPQLLINATALSAGQHLLLTDRSTRAEEGAPWLQRLPVIASLMRVLSEPSSRERRIVKITTTVARAVTASSAVPGIFAPIWFAAPRIRKGKSGSAKSNSSRSSYLAVDGGVFDNQGIHALIDENCRSVLVSDAANVLDEVARPPRFSLPVVRRSYRIIYERVRAYGYRQLEVSRDLHRLLKLVEPHIDKRTARRLARDIGSSVENYAYVELFPRRRFKYVARSPRLPDPLPRHVSRIRTDLDRFSNIEISALMFHGYTLIDHCLRSYRKNWIEDDSPMRFQTDVADVNIDWEDLSDEELAYYARHLEASSRRVDIVRAFRRWTSTFVDEAKWLGRTKP